MSDEYTGVTTLPAKAGAGTKHRPSWWPMAYLGWRFDTCGSQLPYLSAMNIHPGDGSVLVLDLNGQYVYFCCELRVWGNEPL